MSPRAIEPDEIAEIMAAIELVVLADDQSDLDETLLVPRAVVWVSRQPRRWRRIDLVRHLLSAGIPGEAHRYFSCRCTHEKHGKLTGCSGTGANYTGGLCAWCLAECGH